MENLNASTITRPAHIRNWMVIYTRGRWEKKVEQYLKEQYIEVFCPLRKEQRQWADRKKIVEVPLFNSYVFVKITPSEEIKVRQTLGVINFIYFQGRPAIVREKVIANIRQLLNNCPDMETVNLHELAPGDRVRIKSGVFSDHQGNVIQIQGKNILMVLECLECALVAKVKANNIAVIN